MALVTGIKAFTDNTDANPIEVNNNFNEIVTEVNGLLDEENINLDKASFRVALLAALKAVDGAGSGLDADLLDGQSGDYYFDTAAESLVKIKTVDGTLSGLDADLLDGKHYTDIQTWVNASADVPNATNADKLDGKHLSEIFDMFHPVGDIVHRYDSSNPSALTGWSGTWERIGVGKMLIGQDPTDGDFNALGETGGEKDHTLTKEEMPQHNHNYIKPSGYNTTDGRGGPSYYESTTTAYTDSTGGGQAHNNLPPYEVVYIWRRTA